MTQKHPHPEPPEPTPWDDLPPDDETQKHQDIAKLPTLDAENPSAAFKIREKYKIPHPPTPKKLPKV